MTARCRLGTLLIGVAIAAGCVHARNINAPVPGAIETTFPDSAQYVFRAAVNALNDDAIPIRMDDKKRGLVQSQPIGVGGLRTSQPLAVYNPPEDVVTFRLWTRQALGVTRVTAEAVYQPVPGGGRVSERMVRENHIGREAIARIFAHMEQRLANERAERERQLREAPRSSP